MMSAARQNLTDFAFTLPSFILLLVLADSVLLPFFCVCVHACAWLISPCFFLSTQVYPDLFLLFVLFFLHSSSFFDFLCHPFLFALLSRFVVSILVYVCSSPLLSALLVRRLTLCLFCVVGFSDSPRCPLGHLSVVTLHCDPAESVCFSLRMPDQTFLAVYWRSFCGQFPFYACFLSPCFLSPCSSDGGVLFCCCTPGRLTAQKVLGL